MPYTGSGFMAYQRMSGLKIKLNMVILFLYLISSQILHLSTISRYIAIERQSRESYNLTD